MADRLELDVDVRSADQRHFDTFPMLNFNQKFEAPSNQWEAFRAENCPFSPKIWSAQEKAEFAVLWNTHCRLKRMSRSTVADDDVIWKAKKSTHSECVDIENEHGNRDNVDRGDEDVALITDMDESKHSTPHESPLKPHANASPYVNKWLNAHYGSNDLSSPTTEQWLAEKKHWCRTSPFRGWKNNRSSTHEHPDWENETELIVFGDDESKAADTSQESGVCTSVATSETASNSGCCVRHDCHVSEEEAEDTSEEVENIFDEEQDKIVKEVLIVNKPELVNGLLMPTSFVDYEPDTVNETELVNGLLMPTSLHCGSGIAPRANEPALVNGLLMPSTFRSGRNLAA
jgi:hypothetical protein